MDRREALGAMGAAATTGFFASTAAGMSHGKDGNGDARHHGGHEMHGGAGLMTAGYDPEKGEYILPPLPYAYDALEPHIDEQTMRLHHDKHHAGYVAGLNASLKKLEEARNAGEFDMVRAVSRDVSFNGGGHALHTLFWSNMAPKGNGGGGKPEGELAEMIDRDFGSFKKMRDHFVAAASSVRGSGWGILGQHLMSGQLMIIQGEQQHKLTPWAFTPLLVVDVWEHSYTSSTRTAAASTSRTSARSSTGAKWRSG